jgi:hypothetical protein
VEDQSGQAVHLFRKTCGVAATEFVRPFAMIVTLTTLEEDLEGIVMTITVLWEVIMKRIAR